MSRRVRDHFTAEPLHRPRVGLLVVALVAAGLAVGLVGLPRETSKLPAVAREALTTALPHWHTTEPVSEVVYGTRAADTFGETFLLIAAVVSVQLFTRRREGRRGFVGETFAGEEEQRQEDPAEGLTEEEERAREAEAAEWDVSTSRRRPTPDREGLGAPAPETAETMSVVARISLRAVAPILGVAGIYLFAEGYSPGGGFPGGVVAVGVMLLIYAGLGYRRIARAVSESLMELIEVIVALIIIAMMLLGLVLEGSFTANWLPLAPEETLRSGGIMQAFSVSEFFEVAAGLAIAIFGLMTVLHDWTPERDAVRSQAARHK
jgi:multicomponent Na+:H+ antiporter subunit B